MDYAADKKIELIRPQSKQEYDDICTIERTKVIDKLYMKHDIKFADLQKAIQKYDIVNDEDVKKVMSFN